MQKAKLTKKKLTPLLASLALLAGPVLVVTACDNDITRYEAQLPTNEQERILFDFVGVNFSVNAKSQFSSNYKAGMDFIKKQVEGIMAQQEFVNFFTDKLQYSKDDAVKAFTKITDNIGLNLLLNDYLSTINSGQSFDSKVYATKLIFQTENWHQLGTTKFNYANSAFYGDPANNPDNIFNLYTLYTGLDDAAKQAKIEEVAKHADTTYNDEITKLTQGNPTWDSPNTPEQMPPSLDSSDPSPIKNYQQKLDRFKWWLRFRYQQYYVSAILPQLNDTLFTMSNNLDSILHITNSGSTPPKINIDNSKYASQLQDWGPNSSWDSQYRLTWDYTISQDSASNIDKNWNSNPLPDLIATNGTDLNSDFLNKLNGSDQSIRNTVDPIFGSNAYVSDPSTKDYAKQLTNRVGKWVIMSDGTHFTGKNNKGSFAYSTPLYWMDVVQNLNFNYYQSAPTSTLAVDPNDDYKGLISNWSSSENSSTSNAPISKYVRSDVSKLSDAYTQNYKWNLFWQMMYQISSQSDTNPKKDVATGNFTTAAKTLFPKFIKKENIYNIDFWNAVSSYY